MQGFEEVIDWPAPEQRGYATAITTYRWADLDRWLSGVTWTPYGCPDTTSLPVDLECDGVDQTFSSPTAFGSFASFQPFRMEFAVDCSVLGGMGVNGEKLRAYALEVIQADTSRQLARQAMFTQPETENIGFYDEADAVGTSDTTPVGALAAVESGLAQRLNNGLGMIHVSPGMASRLVSASALERRGGQLYSPLGHLVVADAGYVGAGGVAGQSTIYGTGVVRYQTTEVNFLSTPWENFDWANNITEAQAERYGIVLFEPCAVVSAAAVG